MYLPLFHAFGIYEGPLMGFVTGARMVLASKFDPGEILQLIEQEQCTATYGFDPHFHDLMQHPDFATRSTSSIRTGLLASGMYSSIPIARQAQENLVASCVGVGHDGSRRRCYPGFPA